MVPAILLAVLVAFGGVGVLFGLSPCVGLVAAVVLLWWLLVGSRRSRPGD